MLRVGFVILFFGFGGGGIILLMAFDSLFSLNYPFYDYIECILKLSYSENLAVS